MLNNNTSKTIKSDLNKPKIPAHITCRQCGSDKLINRGKMVQSDMFCGVKLSNDWEAGSYYECRHCHLSFRHPIRKQSEYVNLYQETPNNIYSSINLRHDQKLVLDTINRHRTGGTILDVGCFDGALLSGLATTFQKFGIEASKEAQKLCKKAGIEIIADSAEALIDIEKKYDIICAVDVIEHLISPHIFIRDIATKLNPNGLLIISTGNANNKIWRLFGGRYWYCAFPEHISFISSEWIKKITNECPFKIIELIDYQHVNINITKMTAYVKFVGRLIRGYTELITLQMYDDKSNNPKYKLGYPGVAKDHMLIVLQLNINKITN